MIVDIRWTSRSATGREIKRTRRVERDAPTIGRDPGSDVHLPDLGVGLHEAKLRLAGPGLASGAPWGGAVMLKLSVSDVLSTLDCGTVMSVCC